MNATRTKLTVGKKTFIMVKLFSSFSNRRKKESRESRFNSKLIRGSETWTNEKIYPVAEYGPGKAIRGHPVSKLTTLSISRVVGQRE